VRDLRLLTVCICFAPGAGCSAPSAADTHASAEPAPYLFAWAGDQDEAEGDSNFLTVIDADPESATYGEVVATAPVGAVGGMPHHSELVMPPDGHPLFANAFSAGRSWLFDLSDPFAPELVGEVDPVPGHRTPHSFLRTSDGTVLATMQFGDPDVAGQPGGLARFAPDGRVLAVSSSADPEFDGEPIRTYALDASEVLDRVVTTSSPMDDENTADVVQVWRLSDLSLLKTIAVPAVASDSAWQFPFEVKFLEDGRTALMNTFYCGFYLLSGLDGDEPKLERVLTFEEPDYSWCGVPVVIDHYWVMPVTLAREVVVLDIADPRNPTVVSRLGGDDFVFEPHWAAPDPGSDRIVLTSHSDEDPRVLIARLDTETGALTWDETFRDPATGQLGVSFERAEWPHGASGAATPHGVLFGGTRSGADR
jgi:hypothetical protein